MTQGDKSAALEDCVRDLLAALAPHTAGCSFCKKMLTRHAELIRLTKTTPVDPIAALRLIADTDDVHALCVEAKDYDAISRELNVARECIKDVVAALNTLGQRDAWTYLRETWPKRYAAVLDRLENSGSVTGER